MRISAFSRYALCSCAAVALVAGCARSQPPIGAPGANRVAFAPSHPVPIATTPSFEGAVIFASNIVRPSWDHRVVIIEARITNVGESVSRLSDWSVSGTDMGGGKMIYGLIMRPSGTKYVGRTNTGVSVLVPYDAHSYLPNQGDAALRPGATIHGILQVEFARQVDNQSLRLGFRDGKGNLYTIGCLACQMIPGE